MQRRRPRLALATSAAEPSLSADDRLLLPYLEAAGIEPRIVIWSEWVHANDVDAVLVRSAWDYHLRSEEFIRWMQTIERSGVPVWNDSRIALWNSNKRYLFDLAGKGVRIPDSHVMTSIDDPIPPRFLSGHVVVKPIVSAGAFRTMRVDTSEPSHLRSAVGHVLEHGPALLQEHMHEITTEGEHSFVFISGEYSHAITKRPQTGEFRVQEEYGGTNTPFQPSTLLVDGAASVLRAASVDALYARVDAVLRNDEIVLMELELIEPSLYFFYDRSAPGRLARACAARLRQHA